jgi:CRP/FNR family transcriptional regulator, cyclic AMP receptor protein
MNMNMNMNMTTPICSSFGEASSAWPIGPEKPVKLSSADMLWMPGFALRLLKHCRIRSVPSKATIVWPDELADTLHYVIDGVASACIEDIRGRQVIFGHFGRGDFIGEMGFFSERASQEFTVRTVSSCKLASISYERLIRAMDGPLCDDRMAITLALANQISGRLRDTSNQLGRIALSNVPERIYGTLRALCRRKESMTHPSGVQIRISRQDLGRMAGCSREMAGRVLKSAKKQGLIDVDGKTILVYHSFLRCSDNTSYITI